MLPLLETRQCLFSADRMYRYQLHIQWSSQPSLVVIGLNPSTADETQNDPTVRRCIGYARDMNRGGLLMLNMAAFRSTDPRGLLPLSDPIAPEHTAQSPPLGTRCLARHLCDRRLGHKRGTHNRTAGTGPGDQGRLSSA